MVDSIKCSRKVQENEEGRGARIRWYEEVVCDSNEGSLCAVSRAENWLEFFKEVIIFEVVLKVAGNYFIKYFWYEGEIWDGPIVG